MADAAEVVAVVDAHLAAFNARDLDAVVAGLADDAVFTAGGQLTIGRRAIGALFADSFASPVEARLERRRVVVEGDTAAVEMVERLRLDAPHGGGPGEEVEIDVAAFFTVRGGELVRVRVYRETPG